MFSFKQNLNRNRLETLFFRPYGTQPSSRRRPTDESVGYYRVSLTGQNTTEAAGGAKAIEATIEEWNRRNWLNDVEYWALLNAYNGEEVEEDPS